MRTALQVAKAIEILSKYKDITICAEHDEIHLGVDDDEIVSLEDNNALEELRFRPSEYNCWMKYV